MTKQVKLAAIHPNHAIEVEFQRKLDRMIDDMQASIVYWLSAAYKANEPEMAQDESPAAILSRVMRKLAAKWNRKFADAAKPMADYYASAVKDRADAALKSALKKTGMTIEFKVTPQIQDILTATVNENVSLIKTISSEHLADVGQMVMRSVSAGRDLGGLREELQDRYGITKRRAKLIARTSNNQTTAMLTKSRYQELGITKAQWMHSNAGKEPRKSHVAMNGKEYDVSTGAFIDGEYTYPGYLFNCRCIARAILPDEVLRENK